MLPEREAGVSNSAIAIGADVYWNQPLLSQANGVSFQFGLSRPEPARAKFKKSRESEPTYS